MHARLLVVSTLLMAIVACSETTSAPDRALVVGTYQLKAGDPRGPVSGTLVLSTNGSAERRVQYAVRTGGLSDVYAARGTFELRTEGVVSFALHENDGHSPYVWDPRGQVQGRVLELQYADALDGPPIVERYERQ